MLKKLPYVTVFEITLGEIYGPYTIYIYKN